MTYTLARIRHAVTGKTAGLVALIVLWAAVNGLGPLGPTTVGDLDPTCLDAAQCMLLVGPASSSMLGAVLVRAGAHRLLAACGAFGAILWTVELTILGTIDLHRPDAATAAVCAAVTLAGLVLLVVPLAAGAATCRIRRRIRIGHQL